MLEKFKFWKTNNSNENLSNVTIEKSKNERLKELDETFYNTIESKKKELIKTGVTINELKKVLEEERKLIEKDIKISKRGQSNPFKVREDIFITFYDSKYKVKRKSVPYQEIFIRGAKFYINFKYEHGEIHILDLLPQPQLEIDLEEEWNKKESTKEQLKKLNEQLFFIKTEISKGNEKYKLIDIEDIRAEKIRLDNILDSIRYGKTALFEKEDSDNNKKHYEMIEINGEYVFLKVTETGRKVPENMVKKVQGTQVITDVEKITNKRHKLNIGQIVFGIFVFLICVTVSYGSYKLFTFEETLFDERVAKGIETQMKPYTDEIEYLRNQVKSLQNNNINSPSISTTELNTLR